MSRSTVAKINLEAIKQNFIRLSEVNKLGHTIPVIKANAYGHGAYPVATALQENSRLFAVAILEEAVCLRQQGLKSPILVLEGPHERCEIDEAFHSGFTLVLHSMQQLYWWFERPDSRRPKVWLKLDTGMHRLGFSETELDTIFEQHLSVKQNNPVLMTHFHSADLTDKTATIAQINQFKKITQKWRCPTSLSNSAATITLPESHSDWNRVGIALYGSSTLEPSELPAIRLVPAMTLEASVIAIRRVKRGDSVGYAGTWKAQRDSLIATVGIGYADGYPRSMPSGTPVFINGKQASLCGRVSMDMICIDVSEQPDIRIGDRVELWGEHLLVNDIANHAETIGYELLSRVSNRVPRKYESTEANTLK